MSAEVKLSRQSQAIYEKLLVDLKQHILTQDELLEVRKGLQLKDSLGVLGNAVIKAAGLVTAGAVLWNYWPGGGGK